MLESFAVITHAEGSPGAPDLAFPLRMRRAWPRDATRIGVQYTDAEGRLVPAQWHADPERTRSIRDKTRRSPRPACLAWAGGERIALQPGGADSKLPILSELLDTEGASLVSHRPGRRAVVRIDQGDRTTFAKALRPSRAARIIAANRLVTELPARAFGVPMIERADADLGVLVTRAIEGVELHDLPRAAADAFVEGCGEAGRALRSLHAPASSRITPHDSACEISMLADRGTAIERFIPGLAPRIADARAAVSEDLRSRESPHTLVHRDFYDKQIVIHPDGSPTLLDFDTLGVGEPAVDLANMLAHLELRALQGRSTEATAADAASAFLSGYAPDPETIGRCQAYLDATRLRLAMLYAFWPKWARLVADLLGAVGKPGLLASGCRAPSDASPRGAHPPESRRDITAAKTDTSEEKTQRLFAKPN